MHSEGAGGCLSIFSQGHGLLSELTELLLLWLGIGLPVEMARVSFMVLRLVRAFGTGGVIPGVDFGVF